jgi:hypothetical protein
MRVIRSWPADPPAGHARIIDGFERVLTPPFDYAPLAGLGADVLHLDWDTAVSPEDLRLFADRAAAAPGRVLVAPVRCYPGSLHGTVPRALPAPVWNCRVYDGGSLRHVTPQDATCDLFGFGMVYLPADLTAAGAAECARQGVTMSDISFSGWHHRHAGPAGICWDVRPVHVNYPPPAQL